MAGTIVSTGTVLIATLSQTSAYSGTCRGAGGGYESTGNGSTWTAVSGTVLYGPETITSGCGHANTSEAGAARAAIETSTAEGLMPAALEDYIANEAPALRRVRDPYVSSGDIYATYDTFDSSPPEYGTSPYDDPGTEAFWPSAGALDRVRSSVSEDAGSILDSASLNAVDASFGEAFLLDQSLDAQATRAFYEALDPGTVAARFYPLPRQTTEFLNDYAGETILSRMTRVYPPPMFGKVAEIFGAALSGSTFTVDSKVMVTPQTLIDAVFQHWSGSFVGSYDEAFDGYDWFSYATVPDLRLKELSPSSAGIATPTEYGDDATLGRVGAEVLAYPQDDENRLTMRQILDDLLSPFPGTVLRANASGQVQIVPTYGPDASNTAAVTLTTKDAYTVTTGKPSPRGVINKVTVRSQPYVLTDDAGALTQSWFQVESNYSNDGMRYASGTGTALGRGENNLLPTGRPDVWKIQSGRVADGKYKLTDSGGVKMVTADYVTSKGGSGSIPGADITLVDIPDNGQEVLAVNIDHGGMYINIKGKAVDGGVQLRVESAQLETGCFFGCTGWTVRVNLLDATDAWQSETTSVVGSYGQDEAEGDPLPGDAVANSVAAYGEREADISMTGYGITDATVLNRVARGSVLDAINPTLIRTVEQSVWRAFPVKSSHMGSVIELPSGEQGRLIGRTYADDFGSNYGQGTLSSALKIEIIDQDGDGAIDVDTAYLLDETGETLIDESSDPLLDETSGATASTPDPAPSGTSDDGSALTASENDGTHPATSSTTTGDWFVAADGSDSNTGTNTGTPLKTVAAAISKATAGDTILVRAGTYQPASRIVVDKAVTIRAYGSERPIFDGSSLGTGSAGRLFTVTAAGAHVMGFEIRDADGDGGPLYTSVANVTFEDIVIHDCLGGGAYFYGTGVTSGMAKDLVVYKIGDGSTQNTNVPDGIVVTGGATNVTIVRPTVIDCPDDGIDLYNSNGCDIVAPVAIRPGYYWTGTAGGTSGGDGVGVKLGGNTSGTGSNTSRGGIVIGARATGVSHNQAPAGNIVVERMTTINCGVLGVDVGSASGNEVRDCIDDGSTTSHYATGSAVSEYNTWDLSIATPGFVNAAAGDYSLDAGSACIGAASDGGNLGASAEALARAKYWLAQDVT